MPRVVGWVRHRETQGGRRKWLRWLPYLLLLGWSMLIVGLHTAAYPTMGPTDELQHFDYAEKVSRGEFPKRGDRVGEMAMREEACRRIDADFQPPPCDAVVLDPADFQERGYSTAAGQMPLYYAVTGSLGRGFAAVAGEDRLLGPMRLVGGLWLGGALSLLWLAMQDLSVRSFARLSIIGFLSTTPVVLHASSTVNPDATLLLAGASLSVIALRCDRGPHWLVGGCVAALVFVLAEPTSLLAVGVAVGALGLRGVAGTIRRDVAGSAAASRSFAMAAAVLVGTIIALQLPGLWLDLVGGVEPLDVPKNQAFHTPDVPFEKVAGEFHALVTPVRNGYIPPLLRTTGVTSAVQIFHALLLGGLVSGVAFAPRRSWLEALAVPTGLLMFLGGPLIALMNAQSDIYFPIPARYGLPLLAPLAVVTAASIRKGGFVFFTGLVAAAAVAATMFPLRPTW